MNIEKNSKICKKYFKKNKYDEDMDINKILETQILYSGFKRLN